MSALVLAMLLAFSLQDGAALLELGFLLDGYVATVCVCVCASSEC